MEEKEAPGQGGAASSEGEGVAKEAAPHVVVYWTNSETRLEGTTVYSALSGSGWRWDGRRLHVWSDRYGTAPLLFFGKKGLLAVSPSLERLVAVGAPRDLDEAALAVFLRLGFFLAEDTPLQSVRAVPPGGSLDWQEGRLVVSAPGLPTPTWREVSGERARAGFQERFERAMGRCPPGKRPVVVPLSGGRDSRHILFALQEEGHRPDFCLTARNQFPDRPDRDIPRAVAVARALNLPHEIVGARQSWFQQRRRANWEQGLLADENAWYLTVADHLHGRAGTVYDGLAGDVLGAGLYLSTGTLRAFRSGDPWTAARGVLDSFGSNLGGEATLQRVMDPDLYRRTNREVALERLAREAVRHLEAPNPVGSFFFWNRTRREVALQPFHLLRGISAVHTPFLDPEVVDFLMGLSAEHFLDGTFHTRTIQQAYPRHSHIPFGEGKGDHPHPEREYAAFGRELARYWATRGASRWLRDGFLLPRLGPCLAGRGCADSFWFAQLALYLSQLEALLRGRVTK